MINSLVLFCSIGALLLVVAAIICILVVEHRKKDDEEASQPEIWNRNYSYNEAGDEVKTLRIYEDDLPEEYEANEACGAVFCIEQELGFLASAEIII